MSETIDFVPPLTRPPAVAPALRRRVGRNLKAGSALLLLAIGGYAVFRGEGYVTADSAVVSAYTVSLRAPITGYASSLRVRVGDSIPAGALIARLTEPRVDDQHFIELENLVARLRANRRAYQNERVELSLQHDRLVARAEERNRSEAIYLVLQAAEAERQVRQHESARDFAGQELVRKTTLAQTGDVAVADVDKAGSTAQQANMGVEAAIARHAYLLVQARAAEKGLMLESGSADVAYSTQRADEIAIRILECERESDYLAASEIEALARLEAERRRLALLRSVDLVVPADGMVWRLGVSDGERLSVGDMVAELVDCRSVFILAAIPQDRFSDVETGGAARVRLSGETQDRVGRVVSLTGESNLANDRNLAATPVVPRTATAMARIALEASSNSASDCLAGRTARVLLPASSGGSWLALFARHFL